MVPTAHEAAAKPTSSAEESGALRAIAGGVSLTSISHLPATTATAIQPVFHNPSRDRYIRFLRTMFHYTQASESELRHAASLAPPGDLRSLFATLAQEESQHFRLAEADLEALGAIAAEPVSPAVLAIREFWMSTQREDIYTLLGALYVFENVAAHVEKSALVSLAELGLNALQTRFVTVHLHEDQAHGAQVEALCRDCPENENVALRRGAETASKLWVEMHLSILENER